MSKKEKLGASGIDWQRLGVNWQQVNRDLENLSEDERAELRAKLEQRLIKAELSCQELSKMKRFPATLLLEPFTL